ncbi:MAG TPA: SMP-30/gluconolactonase/LRE family protein [Candidatus Tumulicola sp.]
MKWIALLATIWLASVLCTAGALGTPDRLFVSERITPPGEYTSEIEGPAIDAAGNLYVVNLHRAGTIGELLLGASSSRLFAMLPDGSVGSGIRFDREQRMYVADYRRHNIFVFEPGTDTPKLYFHSGEFSQPNDLAMARDGTLFASDPDFADHSGRVWRIDRAATGSVIGAPMRGPRPMGETNGIDLSPDGTTLYVSETDTREVWAYQIDGAALTHARLVVRFPSYKLDGLRTDRAGRLFVARPGNGTVAIVSPGGKILREIALLGKYPTNLTFGGPGGRTVYVTQVDGGFIEAFKTDVPGREPCFGAVC